MDQNIYQNILTFGITQRNWEIFKTYGKVCRPSLLCGKMKQTTGIKVFNKLTMFQYNSYSLSENYARLRARFFVAYC